MKHFFHTLMGCLVLVIMAACEKDTTAGIFAPEVETGTATNIYRKGATLSGRIKLTGTDVADRYGILFSELQSMAEYKEIPIVSGETEFTINIQELEPGETYYFCTYAHSGYSVVKGEVRNFTTSESNAPVFDVPIVSDKSDRSFTITSALLDDGGSELMLSGFCYNEEGSEAPTFMDNVTNVELSSNAITATINGLAPNKTYQIRAYGASNNGLAYSELIRVTTSEAVVPYLSDVKVSETSWHSMTLRSGVLEPGSSEVTEMGVCYSPYTSQPTVIDDIKILGEGHADDFFTTIGDLIPGNTYYFRAYAINEFGIGYSETLAYTIEQEEVAYLVDGITFNEQIKELANRYKMGYEHFDYLIKEVKFATEVQTFPKEYITISADDSPVPAYASFNSTDSLLTVFTSTKDMRIVDASCMFRGLRNLRVIDFGNSEVNETTINTQSMFSECSALTTLDVSNWDTSNVLDMNFMFVRCSSLTTLDVSDWDTSNVANMHAMFDGCSSLAIIDASNWNTENVTDMAWMFYDCPSLTTLNAVNWNIGNVTDMSHMFSGCSTLSKLEMSNWKFRNDVNVYDMFSNCATTSQTCKVTATSESKEFLLAKTDKTDMNPDRFIWEGE